jgi:hypothetical protein
MHVFTKRPHHRRIDSAYRGGTRRSLIGAKGSLYLPEALILLRANLQSLGTQPVQLSQTLIAPLIHSRDAVVPAEPLIVQEGP